MISLQRMADERFFRDFFIFLFFLFFIFNYSAFLRNFFLCQDRLSGDVPQHLAQPCHVALGQALIRGMCPDELRDLSIGFPLSQVKYFPRIQIQWGSE